MANLIARSVMVRIAEIVAMVLVVFASTFGAAAHVVVIQSELPNLTAQGHLRILRINQPAARYESSSILRDRPTFGSDGKCTLNLETGRYRFNLLVKDGSTILALTTGQVKIDQDKQLTLKALKPQKLSLTYRGRKCFLESLVVRTENTMDKVQWSSESGASKLGPSLILSPDESCFARIIARTIGSSGPVRIVLWTRLSSNELKLDLSRWKGWLSHTRFKWLGDLKQLKQIRNAKATWYFPEGDDLEFEIDPKLQLVTNRRFIETSYRYQTNAGEQLEFNRRSHVLSPKHTIEWGGSLSPAAFAMVTMKWDKPDRSLLWGAYLHNSKGDVVSQNEFPVKKPHKRTNEGYPTYLSFRQPFSKIQWQQTLHRIDGGNVPADPENITESDLAQIGDVNRMHDNYMVAASYVLHGKKIDVNVPVTSLVTFKSTHASLQAPIHWGGRPAAYLDKVERIYDICKPLGLYTPDFIQFFWTNNYGSGYTIGPRNHKRIQMGFFDMRDRKGLYSLPDILIHEVLHGFGHKHGRPHNKVIGKGRATFKLHRIFLTDHPEYEPEPIMVVYAVEDARNFGAGEYGKYKRFPVPRQHFTRRVNLGEFRGHKAKVQSPTDKLTKALSLKDSDPKPATWGKGTVNLFNSIDAAKNSVKGKWSESGGQLISGRQSYARFQLGAAPKGSYQFQTQFTRIEGDAMALMFPVGRTEALLVISGWSGRVSGLAFINRKDADRNETKRDGKLTNGVKHTLQLTTRLLDKDRASIVVKLDGKPYIKWEGPQSALTPDRNWRLRTARSLGLGAYDAKIVFHNCQLKALND